MSLRLLLALFQRSMLCEFPAHRNLPSFFLVPFPGCNLTCFSATTSWRTRPVPCSDTNSNGARTHTSKCYVTPSRASPGTRPPSQAGHGALTPTPAKPQPAPAPPGRRPARHKSRSTRPQYSTQQPPRHTPSTQLGPHVVQPSWVEPDGLTHRDRMSAAFRAAARPPAPPSPRAPPEKGAALPAEPVRAACAQLRVQPTPSHQPPAPSDGPSRRATRGTICCPAQATQIARLHGRRARSHTATALAQSPIGGHSTRPGAPLGLPPPRWRSRFSTRTNTAMTPSSTGGAGEGGMGGPRC